MDYDDILNRTWDEIPEPKLLPGGGWALKGKNVGWILPKSDDKSAKVLFSYTATGPVDVAEDLLEELGDDYDISINDLAFTIYIENAADWNKVRKHLALHGVELSGALFDANGKLGFAAAFRGSEVVAEISQRSYENDAGETIWQNQLAKFQKLAE